MLTSGSGGQIARAQARARRPEAEAGFAGRERLQRPDQRERSRRGLS